MKLKFEIILDVEKNKFSCDVKKVSSKEEATKILNINNVADQINAMFDYLSKEYPKKFLKDNKAAKTKKEEKLN